MISPTNPDFSEMRVSQNDRKGKMLSKCFMTRMMLKSYQMIGPVQRIFVMTTASFAHCVVMRFVKGKLYQYFLKSFVLEIQGIYFIPHCIMA